MIKAILSIIVIVMYISAYGQITVINPGLEDTPSDATVPQGWSACAWLTTPDILPGYWGVYTDPYVGDTYAGIITREDSTFESFGQRLSAPLMIDTCYQMSLQLAYSTVYAGYDQPIRLRISISNQLCDESQVIYTSPLVDHEEWRPYRFSFTPSQKARYIMIEAYYSDNPNSHKGNILIDGISSIDNCLRA